MKRFFQICTIICVIFIPLSLIFVKTVGIKIILACSFGFLCISMANLYKREKDREEKDKQGKDKK